jgi:hypothetical protein
MRWLVEVMSLGRTEKDSLYVDADSWQKALQVARTLRGETEPMSGFSIELLDEGCRAVDPASRMSYEVHRADDGRAAAPRPSTAPPKPAPAPEAPSPSAAPPPVAPVVVAPAVLVPPPSVAPAAPAALHAAPEAPPRPRSHFPPRPQISPSATMMLGSPPAAAAPPQGGADGVRPGVESKAPRPEADPRSAPAPAPRTEATSSLPSQIVFKREQDATEALPLTYREYVYVVPPGSTEMAAAALVQSQLELVRSSLDRMAAGKLVNLAVFDVAFQGKPPVPPLATLTWKDWRGVALVSFPRQPGRSPLTIPTGMPTSAAPAAAPPAIVPTPIIPATPPPAAVFSPAPAMVAPTPAPVQAPAAPVAPAPNPFAPAPNPFTPATANPFAPAAAIPNPFVPAAAANPFVPAGAANPFVPAGAANPFAPAAAVPNPFVPAPAPVVAPTPAPPFAPAAAPTAAPPFSQPQPSAPPPQPFIPASAFAETPAPPWGRPIASPAAPAVEPAQPQGRIHGEDLIADLFESMHDLHFARDTVEGGDFCLALAMTKLPSLAGIVQVYDIDRREFVVTNIRGEGTSGLLLRRFPENDAMLSAAMRKRSAVVVPDALQSDATTIERYAVIGGARSLIIAPVMVAGRFLGAIEILNPIDGQPFTESDGNAVTYIAEQFAEFVSSHGIVMDPERISVRPPGE